nr:DUF1214 domain-containing protein [Stigmatella aurantiaca]
MYVERSMDETDSRRSNWLPAPQQGAFNLTMRLYSPKQEAINADWHPPAISRVT